MQRIPLQPIPNQQLTIIVDENQWTLTIISANGSICVSFSKNGQLVMENARAVAGMRIIPSKYQEDGNFVFVTQNEEVPQYTNFDVSQFLIYISQAELNALRDVPEHIITASDFDPNGGLPQAFEPKGYRLA